MTDGIGPSLPPHLLKRGVAADSSGEDDDIGPALPPHLARKTGSKACEDKSTRVKDERSKAGPTHTSQKNEREIRVIGPSLPTHLSYEHNARTDNSDSESSDDIGPALPPHMMNNAKQKKVISDLSKQDSSSPLRQEEGGEFDVETAGDAEDESDSDDGLVGPPVCMAANQEADLASYEAAQFEARYQRMKNNRKAAEDAASGPAGRETWMLELPTIGASRELGLTARTFRAQAAPEQSAAWTRAPGQALATDKKEKEAKKKSHIISERDRKIQEKLDSYNAEHRKESLVDMHVKKQKKEEKAAAAEGPVERRPFDREEDLKVNRFDKAQAKAMMKRAQNMDTRFGHGEKKFV